MTQLAWTLITGLTLPACSSFPSVYYGGAELVGSSPAPSVEKSVMLDVLTYNIEGLQWPARSGRSADLARIGQILNALNASGEAPDVVLFQEVFSARAIRAVKASGYPVFVSGPSPTRSSQDSAEATRAGRPRPTKGELGIRLTGSGLVIASRYPITATKVDAYSRKTCAGFDCLSNKGVMLIRIAIPGIPVPVEIVNTHMNSQKASKVKTERHLTAHRYQVEELAMFLERYHAPEAPLILGGDFNMRHSQDRHDAFTFRLPLEQAHRYCLLTKRCDVRISWDGDAPWMDTQDLQFFASGRSMHIAPVRIEAMFDGSPASPQLSDHDGLRVTYRLTLVHSGCAGRYARNRVAKT
jgi:endonuclease/exonuclease/phosphatase family metal-dependent hydrolase